MQCKIKPPPSGEYNASGTQINLTKTLLDHRQGTIAHALEKTKYEDSDLKWREMDHKYHFSCQFTADMIAMNTSDFIIASTYQEIAGRSVGLFALLTSVVNGLAMSHNSSSKLLLQQQRQAWPV